MMIIEYLASYLTPILSLPFLFFVPGFLANSIFLHNKSLKFDSFMLLDIFVSVAITSFVGLILAQLGLFSLFNLNIILILTSVLLYIKFKNDKFKFNFCHMMNLNLKSLIVILLILSSVLLFLPPFPWIAGGRDPGVYVSTGVHIAKSGSLFIQDPLLAQMNNSIQEALYDVESYQLYNSSSWTNDKFKFQMPGFYITDQITGIITPQFLHIFPIWIAIFYSIFGLAGTFFVNPFFGLLSILSLYVIGMRSFSWKVGALAGFILLLNFTQIWYSRYPFAEIMTQFFVLSGLATFIQFNKESSKYLAVISALLFGLALLTKIETLLIFVPFSLYYIYIITYKKWNAANYYFLIAMAIIFVYCMIDYTFTKPYLINIKDSIINPLQISALNVPLYVPLYEKILNNISMISWYETSFGMILSLIGTLLIISKRKYYQEFILVFIALIYGFFFLANAMNSPDHPWWVRRFVPIFFPVSALFASFTLNKIAEIKTNGQIVSYILTAFLLISLASASYPIMNHTEGYGMIEGVSELAEYFKENDVILMGGDIEGGELSTPLYYIYEKKVIFLQRFLGYRNLQPPEQVSNGVEYILDQNHEVYIVFTPGNDYMEKLLFYLASNHQIDFIDTHEYTYSHLEPTYESLPVTKSNQYRKLNIYKVSKSNVLHNSNYTVDIGTPIDISYIKTGFYGPEKFRESDRKNVETFRWTSSNASIRIPTQTDADLLIP